MSDNGIPVDVKETLESLSEKIYDDATSPAMKQVGQAAEGLMKLVALPFTCLGMTVDELKEKYISFIHRAVNKVPPEKQVEPDPNVAGPLLEHVKYVFGEKVLEKMFNNLLSSSINVDIQKDIHPSFVYLLCQISSYDAKVLKQIFKEYELYGYSPYIDLVIGVNHFERGSITIHRTFVSCDSKLPDDKMYKSLLYLIDLGICNLVEAKRKNIDEYVCELLYKINKKQLKKLVKLEDKPLITKYIVNRKIKKKMRKKMSKLYEKQDNIKYKARLVDKLNQESMFYPEIFCPIELSNFTERWIETIINEFVEEFKNDIIFSPRRGKILFTDIGRDLIHKCIPLHQ